MKNANKKPNHSRAVGFLVFVLEFINRSRATGFVPKTNNQMKKTLTAILLGAALGCSARDDENTFQDADAEMAARMPILCCYLVC